MKPSKNTLNALSFFISFFIASQLYSQVGIGTTTPNANAILDLFSNSKGLLIPRVALSRTNTPAPLSTHTMGMTVYNTANAGSGNTAVSPGFYVNDGSGWVRMADASKVDLTNDAWINDSSNSTVHLGTLSDGETSRSANKDLFIDDSGNITLGGVPNVANRGLLVYGKDMAGTVDTHRFLINATVTPTSSNEFTLFKGSGASTYGNSKVYGLNLDLSGGAGSNHYGVYVQGENKNYFSGDVGIGTSNARAKLHIDGRGDNSAVTNIAEMANDVVITKDGNIGIGTLTPAEPISIRRGDNSRDNFIALDNNNGKFLIGRDSNRGTLNMGGGFISLESSTILASNKILLMSSNAGIASGNQIKGIMIDEINASGTRIAKVNIGSSTNNNILSSFLVSNDTRNIGTQSGKTLIGSAFYQKITADADNLNLVGLDISPTFDDNGQNGVNHYGLLVSDGDVGIGVAKPKVKLDVDGVIKTKAYLVETLPVGVLGAMGFVTDALNPAYLMPVIGGGNIKCPVFYNGREWVCH